MSYLNVSNNADIRGSIPSEFCSSLGVSIDVRGTAIGCYSGCLTSSHVVLMGASPECHDGSIIEQFIIISGVCFGIAVVCTAMYRSYGWWFPLLPSFCVHGQTLSDTEGGGCFGAGGADAVCSKVDNRSKSGTIFAMTLGKFIFGVVISLMLTDWWTYSGGSGLPRNDVVLASCSNPTVGNCFSFCGDVDVIYVNITDDDVTVEYHDGITLSQKNDHTQSSSYCTATLPGYCGYQFWLNFKMLPIVLQLLQVLLQVILWRYGSSDFPSTPQKAQYDLILEQMYPQMHNQIDLNLSPDTTFASRVALLRRLVTPLFPTLFWFLELVTVLFVWGELLYPPVYCGSVLPLSLYYYPILMCLLDLMKLNIYVSVNLFTAGRYLEGVLAMLNLQLFFTHIWVTVALGAMFFVFVLQDCARLVLWCINVTTGRREQLLWSVEAEPAGSDVDSAEAVEMAALGANSTAVNPMVCILAHMVEEEKKNES